MKISNAGLTLIKTFEGFRATPYRDVVGKLTIGFGHLIKAGEVFGAVSSIEATSLLQVDVAFAEDCINSHVTSEISQDQFDALVSFVYNLGCTNFLSSTLLKYVNLYNFELAAAEFKKWNHAGGIVIAGLTNRRLAEAALFMKE